MPRPKRIATLVQMFLMSDGSVEMKIKKDPSIPIEFVYNNLSQATAGLLAAIEKGLTK